MKKQLLKLGIFLLAVVLVAPVMGALPNMPRKYGTIYKCGAPPTINGVAATGEVWDLIPAMAMDRTMVDEVPTFTNCYFKACWNDTALFVLQYVDEDVFMPCWNADPVSSEHWLYDKFEFYIQINDILTAAHGPVRSGNGTYQVAPTYQEAAAVGTIAAAGGSSSLGGFYSDTWDDDLAVVNREAYVLLANLLDSLEVPFVAEDGAVMGFESQWIDVDVTITAGDGTVRQRATWSNTASDDDDSWTNMDSCGVITLSDDILSSVYQPMVSSNLFEIIADNYVKVASDALSASVYDVSGKLVKYYNTLNNQVINIDYAPGVYIITAKSATAIESKKIIVK